MEPITATAVTALLVIYAYVRKSLTVPGILAAVFTAAIHALHPWPIFFTLLITFFLAGTLVTKAKHQYKSTLTSSSSGGSPSAPHPRTYVQVFANSLPASVLILAHFLWLDTQIQEMPSFMTMKGQTSVCLPHPRPTRARSPPNFLNAAPYGVIAMYAAMAADTFASELGILSRSKPVLIINPSRTAPPGTNGAISLAGTLASALGALIIAVTSALLVPFCEGKGPKLEQPRTAYLHGYTMDELGNRRFWAGEDKIWFIAMVTLWGVAGGLLDSLLGALLQASVVDVRSGKVIEGDGGKKVLVLKDKGADSKGGRKVLVGRDILDNNGVNLLMASIIAAGAVAATSLYMGIGISKFAHDVAQLYPTLEKRGWFGATA